MMKQSARLSLVVAIPGIFFAVLGVLLFPFWNIPAARQHNQETFKSAWVSYLRSRSQLDEIRYPQQQQPKGNLDWREFPDGTWIAIAWHCTHDESSMEGEWDGVVLRDSSGDLYWTDYHFCGGEGFQVEFQNIEAKSLAQFYKAIRFRKTPLPSGNDTPTL